MYIKILLGIIFTIFLLSDSFAQERENTLIYAEQSPLLTLNPLNIQDETAFRLSQLMFNSAAYRDKELSTGDIFTSLIPQERTIPSNVYTFKIRQNVRWHDGQPLTAKDIKFTFDMLRNNDTATNLDWIRSVVNNVDTDGSYSVIFRLNRPMGLIPFLEKIGYIKIIPKHKFPPETNFISQVNEFGRSWICGSGPYGFRSLGKGKDNKINKVVLNRHNDYHHGWQDLASTQHRIEDIEMQVIREPETAKQLLVTGRIDMLPVTLPQYWEEIRNSKETRLEPGTLRSCYFVALNNTIPPFSSRTVRVAVTLAVDRWRMMREIYGEGLVKADDLMSGPYFSLDISRDHRPLGYDKNYNYESDNKQRAKELLRQAGYPNGFTVELKAYIQNEQCRRIVKGIKDDLKDINITVNIIEELEKDTLTKEVNEKKFMMAFGQQTFDAYTDVVETWFLRDSPDNRSSYCNNEVERFSEDLRCSYNSEQNINIKNKLQSIIRNDAPYIFLFRVPFKVGCNRNLHIEIDPFWFFGSVNRWYKE